MLVFDIELRRIQLLIPILFDTVPSFRSRSCFEDDPWIRYDATSSSPLRVIRLNLQMAWERPYEKHTPSLQTFQRGSIPVLIGTGVAVLRFRGPEDLDSHFATSNLQQACQGDIPRWHYIRSGTTQRFQR